MTWISNLTHKSLSFVVLMVINWLNKTFIHDIVDEYQISADSSFKETINIMSARHSEAYSCGVRYTKSGDRNCSQTVQLNVYNSSERVYCFFNIYFNIMHLMILANNKTAQFGPVSNLFSHMTYFDFDTENLLCPKEEKDGIVWDWVYASLSAYRPCPEGYLGQYTMYM